MAHERVIKDTFTNSGHRPNASSHTSILLLFFFFVTLDYYSYTLYRVFLLGIFIFHTSIFYEFKLLNINSDRLYHVYLVRI